VPTCQRPREPFCYYVGGSEIADSSLLREISKPLLQNVPSDLICQRLKKKDEAICRLRYRTETKITDETDLSALRVGELKKILKEMGGDCFGCMEKAEYIEKIKSLLRDLE